MAYQALYRKYRPQTFSDVVGQEHITETLKNELAKNTISHAYLFTGTRGTGKTTCAKILARAVNCQNSNGGEPCGECEICQSALSDELTDIVEIDAASNNGVENIRDLREQVSFTPAAAKYRVYIIDEVHMLSISAFNALLKTLEEPPSYVIFILATTEVHKLPATILSRCQRFDFRRIDPEVISKRLQDISATEGYTLTTEAATLIASAADGGMRDALSILDLCAAASHNIDENVVAQVCAMVGNEYLIKLADLIHAQDCEGALVLLDELHTSSVDFTRLLFDLTEHYRNLMIAKTVRNNKKPIICSAAQLKEIERQAEKYTLSEILAIISVLRQAAARMQGANRRCEMEMTVIRLCKPSVASDLASIERRLSALEAGNFVNTPASVQPATQPNEVLEDNIENDSEDEIPLPEAPPIDIEEEETKEPSPEPKKAPESSNTPSKDTGDAKELEEWNEIVKLLRTSCPLIAGVLNGSKAYISDNFLLIDTDSSQFKTLINGDNPLYRDSIKAAAQKVLGRSFKLGPYKTQQQIESDPLSAFAEKLKSLDF